MTGKLYMNALRLVKAGVVEDDVDPLPAFCRVGHRAWPAGGVSLPVDLLSRGDYRMWADIVMDECSFPTDGLRSS
jgi:hypothetical protein